MLTKDEITAIMALINARTSYGQRQETAQERSFKAIWSNAAEKWFTTPYFVEKGETVTLDANEILVPARFGKTKVQKWFDLKPTEANLPLFRNSFEARFGRP